MSTNSIFIEKKLYFKKAKKMGHLNAPSNNISKISTILL